MIDPEVKRFIMQEIERRLNIITSGTAGSNTTTNQTIDNIYPGHPSIKDRPIMHPYGFISRAKRGTIAVTAQQGSHPGNKLTLGHRDSQPPDVEEGEAAVYSIGKFILKVFKDKVQVGKDGEFETLVVGETVIMFLTEFINAFLLHDHLGNLGYPTGIVRDPSPFNDLKANYLDNEKILSKEGGRF